MHWSHTKDMADDDSAAPWMNEVKFGGVSPFARRQMWLAEQRQLEEGQSITRGGRERTPPKVGVLPFHSLDVIIEASPIPKKSWLIKGLIAHGETSAWIAPPGGLKSALMAELSICVGWGDDWHGYKSKKFGNVVYFALERADLVKRRLRAHVETFRTSNPELIDLPCVTVVPGTLDLMDATSVSKVVATIKGIEAEVSGPGTSLIIFDTFAKAIAAGGGDEDKAKDQGRVFANIQRIKDALAFLDVTPHVAIVGHTGNDVERGARGSNAIYGDADILVSIGGDDIKTATIVKANDMAEGPIFSFRSALFEFGHDEDGDPVTVNFVSPEIIDVERAKPKSGDRWTKGLILVRDCINAALIDGGVDHRIQDGPTVRAIPVSAARAIHSQRYVSNGDGDRQEAERKAWARNFKAARDSRLIHGELRAGQEWIWLA